MSIIQNAVARHGDRRRLAYAGQDRQRKAWRQKTRIRRKTENDTQ